MSEITTRAHSRSIESARKLPRAVARRRRRPILFLGLHPRTWVALALLWLILFVGAGIQEGNTAPLLGYPLIVGAVLAMPLVFSPARRFVWRALRSTGRRRPRRKPPSADLLGILTLSTYGFEMYCRDILEREGYTATVTKATGDEGIDVELRAKDGQIGVAQCKQLLNARIGRPVLQQLYGEMINRRATFGFLMTTGTFTDEARKWARTKTITLVDRDELLRMADRRP